MIKRAIVIGISMFGLGAIAGVWPIERAAAQATPTPECNATASQVQNPDLQWAATIGCGMGGHICNEKSRLDSEQWAFQCLVRCGQSWSDPNDPRLENCISACQAAREECPIG